MKDEKTVQFIQELTKMTYAELQDYIIQKGQKPKPLSPFYFDNKLLHQ